MIKIKRGINKYAILSYQMRLIHEHYNFLKCSIKNNVLICTGWISQPDCDTYKIKVQYVVGHEPKTTIIKPAIEPSKDIHMYRDNSLCLSYPPDMKWNIHTPVYMFTVPWISKWIVYYEIYKINGNIWEGEESPVHFKEAEKNIHIDRS